MEAFTVDLLTFISNIVSSIIWPLTIGVLLYLFKEPIEELLPLIKNLKYKGFEVKFAQQMSNINEKADNANLPDIDETYYINSINRESIKWLSELKDINLYSTRTAIIESWVRVEKLIRKLGKAHLIDSSNKNTAYILKELFNKDIISNEIFDICNQLRKIRNKAVHTTNFNVNSESSKEYINLSFRVIAALKDKLKE